MRAIFTLIVIFVVNSAFAVEEHRIAGPTPNLANPNVVQVSDRVFAMVGDMDVPNKINQGYICNSVFVIGEAGVMVFDSGGSKQIGEMIIREIRKRSDKPITHVFNTHHHADHWMGNQAFIESSTKTKIFGHAVMIDTAQQIGDQWTKILLDMTKGETAGTRPVYPSERLQGNETLQLHGLTLKLYHPAHAHTKGDIAVLIEEEKVLLAGDILFYLRTPGFQDASPMGNLKALQDLKQMSFTKVVPGHGPVTDKNGIDYMIDYVHLLHDQVKHYFDEGLADFEMKNKIEVGKYRQMSGFDDRFGINVNRMFLEVEESSF
ncbi:MAG: MBL fold metallo-hydrolase [Gammaproteobacteria bacterium]|nr:MBL fold metallo-hydrolase [Gammaproteobacteria bacterium]